MYPMVLGECPKCGERIYAPVDAAINGEVIKCLGCQSSLEVKVKIGVVLPKGEKSKIDGKDIC